jgi:peptide deformylase
MAILKIARMGHPVLGRVAAPIEDLGAPELRRLVEDMLDTLEDAGGAGLAANQVYVPRRLVVFYVSAGRARREDGPETGEEGVEATEEVPLTVLINPVIEPLAGPGGEEMSTALESCLSVPELAGQVPRHRSIRYCGIGLDGAVIAREASGFHARLVQHECDHLDGILYPQRMTDLSTLTFTSEIGAQELEDQARAGQAGEAAEENGAKAT